MPTAPLTDALLPEICARVAYQLVAIEYRRAKITSPTSPAGFINRVVKRLPKDGFPILTTALVGLQYTLITKKETSLQWRNRACYASRLGYGFRRCFYDDYKATRRR